MLLRMAYVLDTYVPKARQLLRTQRNFSGPLKSVMLALLRPGHAIGPSRKAVLSECNNALPAQAGLLDGTLSGRLHTIRQCW